MVADMHWQWRTMIIPVGLAEAARAACVALTGSASGGMFTRLLHDGGGVATHAISSGYIAGEFADLLPLDTLADGDTAPTRVRPADTDTLAAMLAAVDMEIGAEALHTLLDSVIVMEGNAHAHMDRLGLSLL